MLKYVLPKKHAPHKMNTVYKAHLATKEAKFLPTTKTL